MRTWRRIVQRTISQPLVRSPGRMYATSQAVAAIEGVDDVVRAADEHVVAVPAVEQVRAGAAVERVAAGVPGDGVRAPGSDQDVPAVAEDQVRTE